MGERRGEYITTGGMSGDPSFFFGIPDAFVPALDMTAIDIAPRAQSLPMPPLLDLRKAKQNEEVPSDKIICTVCCTTHLERMGVTTGRGGAQADYIGLPLCRVICHDHCASAKLERGAEGDRPQAILTALSRAYAPCISM